MKLLTKAILTQLPTLGSQREEENPVLVCKFFTPDANWTWYAADGSALPDDDFLFFGYVVGVCPEWGTFRLAELRGIRGALGLPVERDRHFRPTRFSDLKA